MSSFSAEKLKDFAVQVLVAEQVPHDEAIIIADVLVEADLRGFGSHGITRLPAYINRLKLGASKPKAEVEVLRDFPAGATWDCKGSIGQVTSYRAMKEAIKKAKTCGVGFVCLKNNNHTGANAYYARMATESNMIGLVTGNGAPLVAPWGSASAFFSTNPLSFGAPAKKYEPIIIDMATSVSARGKIILANKNNESIPSGWATDAEGHDTTDPKEALKGVLLPFGEHKGYSIALIVEILSGLLSGSAYGTYVNDHIKDPSAAANAGNFFAAINIEMFTDLNEFLANMDDSIDIMHNGKVRPNFDKIYMPGERGSEKRAKFLENGLKLSDSVYNELKTLGMQYNIILA